MTTVLPTSRAIREQLLELKNSNQLIDRFITIGDLFERAVMVDELLVTDDDHRVLMLLDASSFDSFQELHIERNFFTFIRNSRYIFGLYRELFLELVCIEKLELEDTYEDAVEHVQILIHLLDRYKEICKIQGVVDPIFVPNIYRLNKEWVEGLGVLMLKEQGYLSNFELKVIKEMAAIIPVYLEFYANQFNTKMQQKLSQMGLDIKSGQVYTIDLSNHTILDTKPFQLNTNISCTPLSSVLLQVAFVKQKIYEMIKEGIEAQNIVVVLPYEHRCELLREFDDGYFNFAMGYALQNSHFVQICEALVSYAQDGGVQTEARIKRLKVLDAKEFLSRCSTKSTPDEFSLLVHTLLEQESSDEVKEIVLEQLFYFEQLLLKLDKQPLLSLMRLFINRLKKESIDDIGGGKITVMGLLETRGCRYDGVIIIDFNDSFVPHRSEKDLFINTALRKSVGLPTSRDREDLQKFYYHQLIHSAQHVEIGYVSSEDTKPSRFLKELGIEPKVGYSDTAYARLLFSSSPKRADNQRSIVEHYDFASRALSATSLKIFLECKRAYYYRYIQKIREHEIAQDMPKEHEMGSRLHAALYKVYSAKDHYSKPQILKADIAKALASVIGESEIEKFLSSVWLKRLEKFCTLEIDRFRHSRVYLCEKQLNLNYGRLRLEGRIDRIDINSDLLEVLDYKSGSITTYNNKSVESATDFQLEFYYLLASTLGEVKMSGFYDLQNSSIITEPLFARKLELLKEHLSALNQPQEISFDLCEDIKQCRYCPYTNLCDRVKV